MSSRFITYDLPLLASITRLMGTALREMPRACRGGVGAVGVVVRVICGRMGWGIRGAGRAPAQTCGPQCRA